MKILVTAGNTLTPIDKVRCITNIFSGRTGAHIAIRGFDRGHSVTLLTSHAEVLETMPGNRSRQSPPWHTISYKTFDDLENQLGQEVRSGGFDAIIHAAAVSDFRVAGVFTAAEGAHFNSLKRAWEGGSGQSHLQDAASGKIKSGQAELWLRLIPTPKLVDKIRSEWGFTGLLVKFKLEVGVSEAQLLDIAEQSRLQSNADIMVANTLDGMHHWAFLGAKDRPYQKVSRADLADRLIDELERLAQSGQGGGRNT